MSWRASGDLYRAPMSVDNTAGGAGAIDASGAVPAYWDHFWTTVQSTGNDVRVTAPDGTTLATFDLQGFSVATKTCTVEIDNYTAPAAGMLLFWLYWGDSTLASGVTAFVPAAAKSLYFDLGAPVSPLVVVTAEQRPRDTVPLAKIAKTSDASTYIWWDFSAVLQGRNHPSAGSYELEQVSYVSAVTVTLAGVDQAGMKDITKTRFEGGPDGRLWVKTWITGGVTASDYICTVTIVTTEGRTLTGKAKLFIRDMA